MNQMDQAIRLAGDVLRYACNTLTVEMRFLDVALNKLKLLPYAGTLATDGANLYYSPLHVLRSYKQEETRPAHDYFHVVLHCLFRHMFVSPEIQKELWDLACDMAVESVTLDLGLRSVETEQTDTRREELDRLQQQVGSLTAEKIYRYYLDHPLSESRFTGMSRLFKVDGHEPWYAPPAWPEGASDAAGGSDGDSDGKTDGQPGDGSENSPSPQESALSAAARQQLEQEWRDVSERVQQDLETFSKDRGDTAGSLSQNLREVNRETYDYAAFLRKFAVLGEVMKINDDEFDYIFYTYGLKLYDKMPLIEPLEYKEVKRIRDFVIAIDTSGSTSGDLVQAFLQKTYNILKTTESFFSRINLHIIQCDAEIQEHVRITTQEEFDQYIATMQIRGLGGTDFRPVFAMVDELIRKKQLPHLKGMVYFTDGYGTFPGKMPDYKTAFVFVEDDPAERPPIPPWAIRLVLTKNDLKNFKTKPSCSASPPSASKI